MRVARVSTSTFLGGVESTNSAWRSAFGREGSKSTIEYHELQRENSNSALSSQLPTVGHAFERAESKGSHRASDISGPEIPNIIKNCVVSSWKAILTTLAALGVAAAIHFAVPSVHPDRYIMMTTTVVDYPVAFQVPSEYDPICDARSPEFKIGNRDYLETLKDFSFVFLSVASIVNMLTEIIKTASAVLMPPVKPIPDADQFLPDSNQPNNVALRRCPSNRFVTLGSLVPGPQQLWRSGPHAWPFSTMAEQMISFIQGGLSEGKRPEGAEFEPQESVNVLMEAPFFIKVAGISGMKIFLPWSVQTACFLYPIQLASLLYDLLSDSLLRHPDYLSILSDTDMWSEWLLLSFRNEMLLPVLLQVLRIHISIDNLNAFFRGSEGARTGRIILTVACGVALLPKLLVFLPALLVTFLIGVVPTYIASTLLERMTGKVFWHKDGPHLFVLYMFVLPSAVIVSRLFYHFSSGTYLCTHARASLVPIHQGHLTMDAPLLSFLASMFFFSLAVVVPLRFFMAFFPETFGRGVFSFLSPAGFYIRWLEKPLYDTSSMRLDPEAYEEHQQHFLRSEVVEECRWCKHLISGTGSSHNTKWPSQAFIYDGLQQCWEFPCLHDFVYNAQRGAASGAELLGVIKRLRSRHSVSRLRTALDEAEDFAEGLLQAEQLRRSSQQKTKDFIIVVDGIFGIHTKKALLDFLHQQENLPRTAATLQGNWGQEGKRALQSYLKKIGFYTGPLHGQMDSLTIRSMRSWLMDLGHFHENWLTDNECKWSSWTTIALQHFLLAEHEQERGIRHLAVDGQWNVETVFAFQEFLARSGTASPRTGKWESANNKAIQEFLKRRGYLEIKNYYQLGEEELEANEEVVGALEAWLRDQGFPCGLDGTEADGVSGVIHSATRLALQLFLNSERAGKIDKDLVIDGRWKEPTIRRLQELMFEDNHDIEVNGLWDTNTKRGLQVFLHQQGRYVSFLDGDFGLVSIQSLQAWLRDEGFSCGADGVSGTWSRGTTCALQKFLNSRKASARIKDAWTTGPEQKDLEAACWALALFGGAEEWMDEDVLELLPSLDATLIDTGRRTAKARQVLRENGLPVPPEWWGTAQLLANLGNAAWILAAGSEAAVAAVLSLRSLEAADEAPPGVWEMGVAALLGHLRDGMATTVEVVCHAMGKLMDRHLLRVEVHDSTRKVLAQRLRANASIHQAIARGLTAMRSLVGQLWPVLRERLSSPHGLDMKIAAEALAALDSQLLLSEHVLVSSATILAQRLGDKEDWIVRLGACEGLAAFGTKAAGPYLDHIMELVEDEEGPVVAAAAKAISKLLHDKKDRRFQLLGAVRRLQARLPDKESDAWIRAGCCQGIGCIGVVLEDTVQVLSSQFSTDFDVKVVEAAAKALTKLHENGAIDSKVLDAEAMECAKLRLKSPNFLDRWAACVCLGSLGVAALPHLQDLEARIADEDENTNVHEAAKQSHNRLIALQQTLQQSLDRVHPAPSLAPFPFPSDPHFHSERQTLISIRS